METPSPICFVNGIKLDMEMCNSTSVRQASNANGTHVPTVWQLIWLVRMKQVSRTGISLYMLQCLWDSIIYPCIWYLLLTHKSSHIPSIYWQLIWLVWKKQVLRTGTSSYILQCLWDSIIYPCLWYQLLTHKSSHILSIQFSHFIVSDLVGTLPGHHYEL